MKNKKSKVLRTFLSFLICVATLCNVLFLEIATTVSAAAAKTVTVKVVWNDEYDKDGLRPKSIEAHLWADVDGLGEMDFVGTTGLSFNPKVELNAGNNWTYTWNNLPSWIYGIFAINSFSVQASPADSNLADYGSPVITNSGNTWTLTYSHTPEVKPDPEPDPGPKPKPGCKRLFLLRPFGMTMITETVSDPIRLEWV